MLAMPFLEESHAFLAAIWAAAGLRISSTARLGALSLAMGALAPIPQIAGVEY